MSFQMYRIRPESSDWQVSPFFVHCRSSWCEGRTLRWTEAFLWMLWVVTVVSQCWWTALISTNTTIKANCCMVKTEEANSGHSDSGSTGTTSPKVAPAAEIEDLPGEKQRGVIKTLHSGSLVRDSSVLQERRVHCHSRVPVNSGKLIATVLHPLKKSVQEATPLPHSLSMAINSPAVCQFRVFVLESSNLKLWDVIALYEVCPNSAGVEVDLEC